MKCTCGREYALPDRQKHYRESGNHPTCFVCGEGFFDDSSLDKVRALGILGTRSSIRITQHLSSAHLEARCRLCVRQFRSSDDLQNHYMMSLAHPHCALCEVGFADDEACDRVCRGSHSQSVVANFQATVAHGNQPPTTSAEDAVASAQIALSRS